ncbi:MAG: hypothetical protein WC335_07545, partial [Candidatus Omnitrophota bacterium]
DLKDAALILNQDYFRTEDDITYDRRGNKNGADYYDDTYDNIANTGVVKSGSYSQLNYANGLPGMKTDKGAAQEYTLDAKNAQKQITKSQDYSLTQSWIKYDDEARPIDLSYRSRTTTTAAGKNAVESLTQGRTQTEYKLNPVGDNQFQTLRITHDVSEELDPKTQAVRKTNDFLGVNVLPEEYVPTALGKSYPSCGLSCSIKDADEVVSSAYANAPRSTIAESMLNQHLDKGIITRGADAIAGAAVWVYSGIKNWWNEPHHTGPCELIAVKGENGEYLRKADAEMGVLDKISALLSGESLYTLEVMSDGTKVYHPVYESMNEAQLNSYLANGYELSSSGGLWRTRTVTNGDLMPLAGILLAPVVVGVAIVAAPVLVPAVTSGASLSSLAGNTAKYLATRYVTGAAADVVLDNLWHASKGEGLRIDLGYDLNKGFLEGVAAPTLNHLFTGMIVYPAGKALAGGFGWLGSAARGEFAITSTLKGLYAKAEEVGIRGSLSEAKNYLPGRLLTATVTDQAGAIAGESASGALATGSRMSATEMLSGMVKNTSWKEGIKNAVLQLPREMAVGGSVWGGAENMKSLAMTGEYLDADRMPATFAEGALVAGTVRGLVTVTGSGVKLVSQTAPGMKLINKLDTLAQQPKRINFYSWLDKGLSETVNMGLRNPDLLAISTNAVGGFVSISPVFSLAQMGLERTITGEWTWTGKEEGFSLLQAMVVDAAEFSKMGVYLPALLGIGQAPHTVTSSKTVRAFSTEHSFTNLFRVISAYGDDAALERIAAGNIGRGVGGRLVAGIDSASFVSTMLTGVRESVKPAIRAIFPDWSDVQVEQAAGMVSFASLFCVPRYYQPVLRSPGSIERDLRDALNRDGLEVRSVKPDQSRRSYVVVAKDAAGGRIEFEARFFGRETLMLFGKGQAPSLKPGEAAVNTVYKVVELDKGILKAEKLQLADVNTAKISGLSADFAGYDFTLSSTATLYLIEGKSRGGADTKGVQVKMMNYLLSDAEGTTVGVATPQALREAYMADKYARQVKSMDAATIKDMLEGYSGSLDVSYIGEKGRFNELPAERKIEILVRENLLRQYPQGRIGNNELKTALLDSLFLPKDISSDAERKVRNIEQDVFGQIALERASSDPSFRNSLVSGLKERMPELKQDVTEYNAMDKFIKQAAGSSAPVFNSGFNFEQYRSAIEGEAGYKIERLATLLYNLGERPYQIKDFKDAFIKFVEVSSSDKAYENSNKPESYILSLGREKTYLDRINSDEAEFNNAVSGFVFFNTMYRSLPQEVRQTFTNVGAQMQAGDGKISIGEKIINSAGITTFTKEGLKINPGQTEYIENIINGYYQKQIEKGNVNPNDPAERANIERAVDKMFQSLERGRLLPDFGTIKGKTTLFEPLEAKIIVKVLDRNVWKVAPQAVKSRQLLEEGFGVKGGTSFNIYESDGVKVVMIDLTQKQVGVAESGLRQLNENLAALKAKGEKVIIITDLESSQTIEMNSLLERSVNPKGSVYTALENYLVKDIGWIIGEETGEYPKLPNLIVGTDGNQMGAGRAQEWGGAGTRVSRFMQVLYNKYSETSGDKVSREGFKNFLEAKGYITVENDIAYPTKIMAEEFAKKNVIPFEDFNNKADYKNDRALLNSATFFLSRMEGKDFAWGEKNGEWVPVIMHSNVARPDMHYSQLDRAVAFRMIGEFVLYLVDNNKAEINNMFTKFNDKAQLESTLSRVEISENSVRITPYDVLKNSFGDKGVTWYTASPGQVRLMADWMGIQTDGSYDVSGGVRDFLSRVKATQSIGSIDSISNMAKPEYSSKQVLVVVPGTETTDMIKYKKAFDGFGKTAGGKTVYQQRSESGDFFDGKTGFTPEQLANKISAGEQMIVILDRASRQGYTFTPLDMAADANKGIYGKTLMVQVWDEKIGMNDAYQYIRRNRNDAKGVGEELWLLNAPADKGNLMNMLQKNEVEQEATAFNQMTRDFAHQSLVNNFNKYLALSTDQSSCDNIISMRREFQSESRLNDKLVSEFANQKMSEAMENTFRSEWNNFKYVARKDGKFYDKLNDAQKMALDMDIKGTDAQLKQGINFEGRNEAYAKYAIDKIGVPNLSFPELIRVFEAKVNGRDLDLKYPKFSSDRVAKSAYEKAAELTIVKALEPNMQSYVRADDAGSEVVTRDLGNNFLASTRAQMIQEGWRVKDTDEAVAGIAQMLQQLDAVQADNKQQGGYLYSRSFTSVAGGIASGTGLGARGALNAVFREQDEDDKRRFNTVEQAAHNFRVQSTLKAVNTVKLTEEGQAIFEAARDISKIKDTGLRVKEVGALMLGAVGDKEGGLPVLSLYDYQTSMPNYAVLAGLTYTANRIKGKNDPQKPAVFFGGEKGEYTKFASGVKFSETIAEPDSELQKAKGEQGVYDYVTAKAEERFAEFGLPGDVSNQLIFGDLEVRGYAQTGRHIEGDVFTITEGVNGFIKPDGAVIVPGTEVHSTYSAINIEGISWLSSLISLASLASKKQENADTWLHLATLQQPVSTGRIYANRLKLDKLAQVARLTGDFDILLSPDKEALFKTDELQSVKPQTADYIGENNLGMAKLLSLADLLYRQGVDDLTVAANMAKAIPVISQDAQSSVSLEMSNGITSSGLTGQIKALKFAASEIDETKYPEAKKIMLDMAAKMDRIDDLKQSPFLKDKIYAKVLGVANAVLDTVSDSIGTKGAISAAKQSAVSVAGFTGMAYLLPAIGLGFIPMMALTPASLAMAAVFPLVTQALIKASSSAGTRSAILEESLNQIAQPKVSQVYQLAEALGIENTDKNPEQMTALTMLFAPWYTDIEAKARFNLIANRNLSISSNIGNKRISEIISTQKSSENIKSYAGRVSDMASTLKVDGKQTVVSPSRVRAILNGMLTKEEARKAMENAGMTAEQMDDLKQQLGIKEQMLKDTVETITNDIFNNPLVRHILYIYEKEGKRMPVNERTKLLTDAFNVIGMVTRSVYAHNPDVWTLAETAARKQTGCVTNMQIDYIAARLLGIPEEQIIASRGQYSDERPHLLLHITFPDGKDRFVDSTPDGQGRVNYVSDALTIADGRLTDKTANFYIDNYYNFRNLGKGASGVAAGVLRNIGSKGEQALSDAMKSYQEGKLKAGQIRAMTEYRDYKALRQTAFALDPEISTNREKYLPVIGVELSAILERLSEDAKTGTYNIETLEKANASLKRLEGDLDKIGKTISAKEYSSVYIPELMRRAANEQLKQYADKILLAEGIAETQGIVTEDIKSVKADTGVNGNLISKDTDSLLVNPVLLSREVSSFAKLVGNGNAAQAAVDIGRKLVESGNGNGALPASLKSLVDIAREVGRDNGDGNLKVFKQEDGFLVTNGAPDKSVEISEVYSGNGNGIIYRAAFSDRPIDRSGLEEVNDASVLSGVTVGEGFDGGSDLAEAFKAAVMPFGQAATARMAGLSYVPSSLGGSNDMKALNENTGIYLNNLSLGNTQITEIISYLMSLTLPYATGPPQDYAYDSFYTSSNSSKANRIFPLGSVHLGANNSYISLETQKVLDLYDGKYDTTQDLGDSISGKGSTAASNEMPKATPSGLPAAAVMGITGVNAALPVSCDNSGYGKGSSHRNSGTAYKTNLDISPLNRALSGFIFFSSTIGISLTLTTGPPSPVIDTTSILLNATVTILPYFASVLIATALISYLLFALHIYYFNRTIQSQSSIRDGGNISEKFVKAGFIFTKAAPPAALTLTVAGLEILGLGFALIILNLPWLVVGMIYRVAGALNSVLSVKCKVLRETAAKVTVTPFVTVTLALNFIAGKVGSTHAEPPFGTDPVANLAANLDLKKGDGSIFEGKAKGQKIEPSPFFINLRAYELTGSGAKQGGVPWLGSWTILSLATLLNARTTSATLPAGIKNGICACSLFLKAKVMSMYATAARTAGRLWTVFTGYRSGSRLIWPVAKGFLPTVLTVRTSLSPAERGCNCSVLAAILFAGPVMKKGDGSIFEGKAKGQKIEPSPFFRQEGDNRDGGDEETERVKEELRSFLRETTRLSSEGIELKINNWASRGKLDEILANYIAIYGKRDGGRGAEWFVDGVVLCEVAAWTIVLGSLYTEQPLLVMLVILIGLLPVVVLKLLQRVSHARMKNDNILPSVRIDMLENNADKEQGEQDGGEKLGIKMLRVPYTNETREIIEAFRRNHFALRDGWWEKGKMIGAERIPFPGSNIEGAFGELEDLINKPIKPSVVKITAVQPDSEILKEMKNDGYEPLKNSIEYEGRKITLYYFSGEELREYYARQDGGNAARVFVRAGVGAICVMAVGTVVLGLYSHEIAELFTEPSDLVRMLVVAGSIIVVEIVLLKLFDRVWDARSKDGKILSIKEVFLDGAVAGAVIASTGMLALIFVNGRIAELLKNPPVAEVGTLLILIGIIFGVQAVLAALITGVLDTRRNNDRIENNAGKEQGKQDGGDYIVGFDDKERVTIATDILFANISRILDIPIK